MFHEDDDRISELLREDSDSIKLSDDFLEKSFERLQAKMRYVRNVRQTEKSSGKILKWPVSIAAAAAVFLVMFVPFYYGPAQNAQESFLPVSSAPLKPIASNTVRMDSSIASENLALAVKNDSETEKTAASGESEFNDSIVNSQIIENLNLNEALTSVDVFKNKVEAQPYEFDFSVSMPETHTVKNSGSIRMPKNRLIGR